MAASHRRPGEWQTVATRSCSVQALKPRRLTRSGGQSTSVHHNTEVAQWYLLAPLVVAVVASCLPACLPGNNRALKDAGVSFVVTIHSIRCV